MKIKDYVTLGNLLGGFGAMVALIHHQFDLACWLLFVAYAFDVADGPVARLTKQFDTFGGHFDTVCDFVTNSVTSSLMVYYVYYYTAQTPWWFAFAVAAFPISTGTIRQARGSDRPLSYPCYWLGVPRPVSAFFIVALLQSQLAHWMTIPGWQGGLALGMCSALIVGVSMAHLSTFPFVNHVQRRWMGALRFGKAWFLVGTPISAVVGWVVWDYPKLFFDWLLFSMCAYLFVSWTQIPKTDWVRIRRYLNGGPIILPLVHRSSTWRPTSAIPAFDPVLPDPAGSTPTSGA
ncbi:MAG: CDP-alcohol phosphatidyltransferase family protein [Myxococcales bacterium]|nr:CDP-alcohol phosphatidyltransferase family protein [Myxococcales bacterium]